jgi:site-specific DNA recombinase
MAPGPQRVIIYDRLSEDRAGDAASIENHLQSCRDHAASRGWTVVAEEVDRDKSGYKKGVKRPALGPGSPGRRARRGRPVPGLEVRSVVEAGHLFVGKVLDLCESHDVTFSTVVEAGAIDTSTPTGRIIMSVVAELARAESESLSERQDLRHQAAAERGEMHAAGRRPYGYGYDGAVIEDEAVVIREVADRLVRGDSLRAVARSRNERGMPTSGGGRWQHQNVRAMITSDRARRAPRPQRRGLRRNLDADPYRGPARRGARGLQRISGRPPGTRSTPPALGTGGLRRLFEAHAPRHQRVERPADRPVPLLQD